MKMTKEVRNIAHLINKECPLSDEDKDIIKRFGFRGYNNSKDAIITYEAKEQDKEE